MENNNSLKELMHLDIALNSKFPSLNKEQIKIIRSKLIQNITERIEKGFEVAFVKMFKDEKVTLQILKLDKITN